MGYFPQVAVTSVASHRTVDGGAELDLAAAARELPLTATDAHLTPSHHGLAGVATGARMTSLLGLLADPVRARLRYALDVAEEVCVGDLALAWT